jgi:hypothetical protein
MARIKINGTTERVKTLLQSHPHLRDDDNRLIANILRQDIINAGYDPKLISGQGVLKLIAEGRLTNTESIRRSRADLQKVNEKLRGNKYKLKIRATISN